MVFNRFLLTYLRNSILVLKVTTTGWKRYVMDRDFVRNNYCILCFSVRGENCLKVIKQQSFRNSFVEWLYRLTPNGLVLDPRTRDRTFNVYALFAVYSWLNTRVNSFVRNTTRFLMINDMKVTYGSVCDTSYVGSACCVTSCVTNANETINCDWAFFLWGEREREGMTIGKQLYISSHLITKQIFQLLSNNLWKHVSFQRSQPTPGHCPSFCLQRC